MSPWNAVKADTYRLYGRFSWACLIRAFFFRRAFRAIATMRLCQAASASRGLLRALRPLFRLLHHFASHRAGVDFPAAAEVGGGLAINHGWGLVVNKGARIGNNVTLFHGVTIGRRDRVAASGERVTEYPELEDEVWVGPHAIIVGGVRIGRGSRISGGALVTSSIPPYSVVVGNPAQVVRSGCTPDVMNKAPL